MPDAASRCSLFELSQVALAPRRLIDATASIHPGVTAVLGASGAGKTSLLNILVQFEQPSSGTVERPAKVFWAPQDGGLWPGMTVHDHLSAMTRDHDTVNAMLSDFDLRECEKRMPATLSRGQKARLSVARALLADASALVMDEPLAHVDSGRRASFWETIRNSIARREQSLVFATHEPELVLGEAEHVLCMAAGTVVFCGPVTELYWNPKSLEHALFLGPANWISSDAGVTWFNEAALPRCLRPEQIQIVAPPEAKAPPITVEAVRFRGSYEELSLRHGVTGEAKSFWHRPTFPALKVGDAVALSLR